MIVRADSRFIHGPALPLPFRALGLDGSFSGTRGVAMWNPVDSPVTTITLVHGQVDFTSPRPSVRVVTETTTVEPGAVPVDAAGTALRALPGISWEESDALAAALRRRHDIVVDVDGEPTPFALHRHGSRHWLTFAALADVEVAVVAHAAALEDVRLVTLDAELSAYEAAPRIVPRLPDLAGARADLVLGWLEPVMISQWAHQALRVGVDVPALHRIVAGDPREEELLVREFEQALDDLGAPVLDVTRARWHVARTWAAAAVDGELHPEEAARRIATEVYHQLGRPESLQRLVSAHREVERRGVVTGNLLAELLAGARTFLSAQAAAR